MLLNPSSHLAYIREVFGSTTLPFCKFSSFLEDDECSLSTLQAKERRVTNAEPPKKYQVHDVRIRHRQNSPVLYSANTLKLLFY